MKKSVPLLSVDLATERDVVLARQRARQVAELLGFGGQDQSRLATASSEICRNALRYAGAGRCEFSFDEGPPHTLTIRVSDRGPGIPNLDAVLGGRYVSARGLGLGLAGTRRLMDHFDVETVAGKGTTVAFGKQLPAASGAPQVGRIAEELARTRPADLTEEVARTDREMLRAIAELRMRNEELEQIRGELEETNRGVVALYAELDEKAESLRKATELKSRFLSNMSHEFRTPLNSILSLTRLVLDGAEGPLSDGQTRALQLVRKSTSDLAEMVNDLLDLAKIEAGKVQLRAAELEPRQLLASLRGVLRPLLAEGAPVQLVVEEPEGLPLLYQDEGKIQQVLRNFASNALKFTPRGEVRIDAVPEAGGILFRVRDTGIGIPPEEHERIFEEFTQVDGAHQRGVKGTGLGLPLCRRLATLLGGEVRLESEVGRGSTFGLWVPVRLPTGQKAPAEAGAPVLALSTDDAQLALWERHLASTRYRLIPARTAEEARAAARRDAPLAVIAGAFLGATGTLSLLAELKKERPGLAVVGLAGSDHERRLLSVTADLVSSPLRERHELLDALARVLSPTRRVLLIAAERHSRDDLRAWLSETGVQVIEARDVPEGLRRAREEQPSAVVLEATDRATRDAVRALREEAATHTLPVVVRTSQPLEPAQERWMHDRGARVVPVEARPRDEAARLLRQAVWEAGSAHA